jgi:DNA polymerase-3 subunit alpha
MEFIFDIETNGLPKFQVNTTNKRKRDFPIPSLLEAYDSARIVSIAWIIIDTNKNIIQQEYYIIKPDNFIIPDEVVNIHGITTDYATQHGIDIHEMFFRLNKVLEKINKIISYNIQFDINVLKSEMIRYNQNLNLIDTKFCQCAMLLAQKYMHSSFYPKLSAAYHYLFNEPIQDAHNAMGDTITCYKVYKAIPSTL